jgi:uncharacterized LabA/DUF88 family protein
MGKQRQKHRQEKAARHQVSQRRTAQKARAWHAPSVRVGRAKPHAQLVDNCVHVFVDDQNLFWGVVNESGNLGFRIDFGELLTEVSKDAKGNARPVKSAYIAGVIPDDDSFWKIAENQGFTVRRGYLGSGGRSKQDDAYLIADMTAAVYEEKGPSTVVLVAGDADYVPPLIKSLDKGWRNEVAFINRGASVNLELVVHEFRVVAPEHFTHAPKGYAGKQPPEF